ncbi:MAG: hypothetical protein ACOC5T_03220 [Elusimicrobiota bacterium]
MIENNQKVKEWPNNPNLVKPSSIQMPSFKKYYPSTDDMNEDQLRYFKYWKKEWQARRPRYCKIRFKVANDSDLFRPPIPIYSGHFFQYSGIWNNRSGAG